MTVIRPNRVLLFLASLLVACPSSAHSQPRQLDEPTVIHGVDAAVKARLDGIVSYTVTEHYVVYRNNDEAHPAAEMAVKTTYEKETGKSYAIISESGSEMIRKFVLQSILDNEKRINEPGTREGSWITSANYQMKLKPGGIQQLNGRDCYVLSIDPKQKAPNLIVGSIWVDARDQSLVQLQGTASKSISVFTGPTQVMRQYENVNGFAEATHARAESESTLFGKTVVTIDYQGCDIKIRTAP
jgi:outer membrane lipoprotein-sorting protein